MPATLDSLQFFKHSSNIHHWAIILPVPSTRNIPVLIYILHVLSLTSDLCLCITLPVIRSLTDYLTEKASMPHPHSGSPQSLPLFLSSCHHVIQHKFPHTFCLLSISLYIMEVIFVCLIHYYIPIPRTMPDR